MNCKQCDNGQMVLKNGKNGAFMACDQYPRCKATANAPEGAVVPTPKPSPTKEFHLSPEQVRTNALNAAIASMTEAQLVETKDVIDLAVIYEIYIEQGRHDS